jgi:hypothetical protein
VRSQNSPITLEAAAVARPKEEEKTTRRAMPLKGERESASAPSSFSRASQKSKSANHKSNQLVI